jgi:hypothetical protein
VVTVYVLIAYRPFRSILLDPEYPKSGDNDMHDSVLSWGDRIVASYQLALRPTLEVGSLDVNGSLRRFFGGPYFGVDIRVGPGVDVVASASTLPFRDSTWPVVVYTEVLEHDDTFGCRSPRWPEYSAGRSDPCWPKQAWSPAPLRKMIRRSRACWRLRFDREPGRPVASRRTVMSGQFPRYLRYL